MNIKQLSTNGYHITDCFVNIPNIEFVCDISQGLRQIHYVKNKEFLNELIKNFNMKDVLGIQLWHDYPGYENHYHYDDPLVENIGIIYLDGIGTVNMGTGYIEEGEEFQISYKINHGLVLKNSKDILHGMIGTVADVEYRTALYFNWKS